MQKDYAINSSKANAIDKKKLFAYLKSQIANFPEIIEVQQYPGGFSNITFNLQTATKNYILRQAPEGVNIKNAHDMQREFTILKLLESCFDKSPKPLLYCQDAQITGMPFYIMEKIEGIILRAPHAAQLNIDAKTFRQLSEQWVTELAVLHQIDIQKTGLAALGKPEGYTQRQVKGWIERYYNAETQEIAEMNLIAEWMPKHLPETESASFLHNDYKYDNVILHPQNISQIVGVLDWEMSTVGNPLMDLGAALAYWSEAGDDDATKYFNLTWLPGNFTRQEVVENYKEKTGFDTSKIIFYYVFGLFKNAVIAQQIYARWKKGLTQDSRFSSLMPVILGLAHKAVLALDNERL